MRINVVNFGKLNELLSLSSRRKPKIVLNPEDEFYIKPTKENRNIQDIDANMICDKEKWVIPETLYPFIEKLAQNEELNSEDKILLIYEKLCKDYIYDDNVLSYIKKYDDDKFALPDYYGRETNEEWKKNRKTHNRRNCFEISRILAKAITELFKGNDKYNICILYDVDLAHYFVGLACEDYTLTLDLDNFDNIKDMTRLKTELTAEGIVILEDNENKFKRALDNFNKDKSKYALKKIESDIKNKTISNLDEGSSKDVNIHNKKSDEITFIENAISILKEDFNIDSQGLFEYMKEIVDIKLGPDTRTKLWKRIEGKNDAETRYMRCLVVDIDNNKYLIDSEEKVLRTFDESELKAEDASFIPYKDFSRDWENDRYNGI